MKKLIAFIGIAFLLIGIRFYDTGLYRFTSGGSESLLVYNQTEYTPEIFYVTKQPYRIDGISEETLSEILEKSRAKIIWTEMDGTLLYAYSPLINRAEWVNGKRFNLMIYKSGKNNTIGVPIIMGSY